MGESGLRLLRDVPSLLIDNILVVSDIHLGVLKVRDIKIIEETITHEIEKIIHLLEKYKPAYLIINGDLKDDLGEPPRIVRRWINFFLEELSLVNEIIIIKGNHDGKIEKTIECKNLQKIQFTSRSIISNGGYKILILHGHQKIRNINLLCSIDLIITGHIHPAIEFIPKGPLVKVWGVFELYLTPDLEKKVKWIVMPAFSSMLKGMSISNMTNEKISNLSPFPITPKIFKKQYLLLDLTVFEEEGDYL